MGTDAGSAGPGQAVIPRPDLFEKCRNYGRMVGGYFMRPQDARAAGLYTYFEVFGPREGCAPGEIRLGDRTILMFGSNDYLDLISHPKVKQAAMDAVRRYGSGCSGSRLLNGTLDLHVRLEAELAAFVGKPAAMSFGTGFQTNYAALSGLTEKGDVLICDHNLHASLVEGALRSTARTVRFRHNDMEHLERCLKNCAPEERILIVCESVFSMEGDVADLRGAARLARRYNARVFVDEAHGIGVFGPTGAGVAEQQGVLAEMDVVMGTFSKSLASVGGFIASSQEVIEYLKHTTRGFVFSAALPPASVAAVLAALEVIREEPERRQRLLRTAALLRSQLRARGFWVFDGETPIVPVVIPNELDLFRVCRGLLDEGIYVNPVLKPAASQNLVRISCTAAHTEAHVERLVETLAAVTRRLGIDLSGRPSA
jgi:8-amino-7-oxononanoate synthase